MSDAETRNPYKREMDGLAEEIRDHEGLLRELSQAPGVEADRRQLRETIRDLQTELAHYFSALEPGGEATPAPGLTSAPSCANLPANNMEDSMARKAKPDQPKRQRSRKKKEAAAEPVAAAPAPEPAPTAPVPATVPPVIAEQQVQAPPEPEQQAEPTHAERHPPVAKHGREGDRTWDIHLKHGEHKFKWLTTAGTKERSSEVVIRFKKPPTQEQAEILQRYGFLYEEDTREAYRWNDPAGRDAAFKATWYLSELARNNHEAGHAVAG